MNEDKAAVSVFQKMKHLIEEYYIESDKITVSAMQSEADKGRVDENLYECGFEIKSNESDQIESVSYKTHADPMEKEANTIDKVVVIND